MNDLKKRIESISRDLSHVHGQNTDIVTIQTDVENTYLDHKEILAAVTRLCNAYKGTLKVKPYNTRSAYKDYLYVEKCNPNECTWQKHNDKQKWQEFHLTDIIKIVEFDLAHTYTTSGTAIYKQKKGAPIGGFLSSNYANIKCAYEHRYHCRIQTSPIATTNYRAIRQANCICYI